MKNLPLLAFAAAALALQAPPQAPSERPARADETAPLVFGMSTALSGPAADLGVNMRAGVLAAFGEANRTGGVHGRQLELRALDDGYEPERTAPNMHAFVDDPRVLGVIGNVGTPTAIVALPIARQAGLLLFGSYTGANALRLDPPDPMVINYRASYAEEIAAMVDALIVGVGLKHEEIAFFTQRDGYGDAGFAGGIAALTAHGLADPGRIVHARYERNSIAVENALADILMAPVSPRAVIMVGTYAPCAKFIELAKELSFEALFLNVSFVGTRSLACALGANGDGVVVTQVVPHHAARLEIARRYAAAMHTSDEDWEASFGSFEGYIAGRILIRAMRTWDGELERGSLVQALENLGEFDLGMGKPLSLSETAHQASHSVWPTVLRGGVAERLEWSALSSLVGGD